MRSSSILRKAQLLLRKSAQPHPILQNSKSRPCLPRTARHSIVSKTCHRSMSSIVDESVASSATEPPPPPALEAQPVSEEATKEEPAVAIEPPQIAEVPKVKISRRSIRNAAPPPPKDTEVVELPDNLDIFWLPAEESTLASASKSDASPPADSDLPPPEILEEALNKLLITLHPQVQHRGAYPSGGDSLVEPTLGLYCPIEGGEYVIDATVRELARKTGAEVLVLDSVQLAAGESGQFGKAANSLQLPTNPLHLPSESPSSHGKSEASEMDEDYEDESESFIPTPRVMTLTLMASPQMRNLLPPTIPRRPTSRSKIKVFFDTLINSSPKSDTDASSSSSTASSSPRPRIIYIRDFSTLAATSSTWYPALLSAVRQRRRGPISRSNAPVANPITIVFGMTPPLTPTPSGAGPGSSLVSYLMNRNPFSPNNTAASNDAQNKTERVDWSESEAAEKARERRLQDRLKKWEKHELALYDEFPKLSELAEEEDGMGGAGEGQKPEMVMLGSGGRGMPPIMGQPQPGGGRMSFGLGRGGAEEGERKAPFFRSTVLVPATRSHEKEKETRMARRREINELVMRMGVGAVGGSVEDTAAHLHFGKPIEVQESAETPEPDEVSKVDVADNDAGKVVTANDAEAAAAPEEKVVEMWDDWANRIEAWPTVKKIADRAVGSVLTSALSSSHKSLDATVVPWDSIKSAWLTRKALRNQRRVWLKDAGKLSAQDLEKSEKAEAAAPTDAVVEAVRTDPDLDAYEQRLLGCIVDSAAMPTSFSQVHLPPHTIDSVRTIVSLPLLHPHAFKHGILKQHSMSGCLLFGPPGTGKTLVVRALAKDAGCRMLAITPSDIMDMYVGEAEKLVRAVFSLARRLSPCVVFLDEIDALFGARMSARESGGAAAAHRGVITEFMQEMDGLKSSKEDGIVVIGATNRPFDLDDAVLRRLPRRLLVDLPGEKEREGILKILLRDETLGADVTPAMLAAKTESFSGSDLKHLCVAAALDAVKEHFKVPWKDLPSTASASSTSTSEVSAESSSSSPEVVADKPASETPETATTEEGVEPITPEVDAKVSAEGGDAATASEAPANLRVLHLHNFTKALKEITPSSSESLGSLADLRKWNDEFGEGRKGKRKSPWGRGLFGFVDAGKPTESTEGRVAASTSTTTPTPSP